MASLASGASARLSLTSHALHRHARRAQRELASLGIVQPLSFSQEFTSRVLGFKNWHEALQVLDHSLSPPPSTSATTWVLGQARLSSRERLHDFLRWARQHGFARLTIEPHRPILGERLGSAVPLTDQNLSAMDVTDVLTTLCQPDVRFRQSSVNTSLSYRLPVWPPETVHTDGAATIDETTYSVQVQHQIDHGSTTTHLVLVDDQRRPFALQDFQTSPAEDADFLNADAPGLTIVAGPAQSGKTALLAAVVQARLRAKIGQRGQRLVMISASPETWSFSNVGSHSVSQTRVNHQASQSFSDLVHTVLRTDPDVILASPSTTDDSSLELLMSVAARGHRLYVETQAKRASEVIHRWQAHDRSDEKRVFLFSILRSIMVQMPFVATDGRPLWLREHLIVDADFAQRLLDAPERWRGQVAERLNETQTSFAHDAQRRHAEGRLNDQDLQRIQAWARSS